MARNGSTSEGLVKKNSKLETFLKRNLDEGTYERIRAYEPCIVVSEKEDKAYKYVVLTDEWICLTENPPKKVLPVLHLQDVVTAELANDFPEFLQGEERENAQHLVIKYLTDAPLKKRVSLRKKKSSFKNSAQNGSMTDRDSGHKPEHDFSRSTSRSLPQQSSLGSGKESLQYRALVTPRANVKSPILEELQNGRQRSSSFDSSMTQTLLQDVGDKNGSKKKNGKKLSNSLPSTGLRKLCMCRSVKASPHKRSVPRRTDGDELNSRPESPLLYHEHAASERGSPDLMDRSADHTDFSPLSLRFDENRHKNGISSLTTATMGDFRQTSIHLYLLTSVSPLLMLIRCAKDNYLIRGTLQQDEYIDKSMSLTARSQMSSSQVVNPGEKMALLFNQLKQELLSACNSMEDTFDLLQELKTATERNHSLKKHFWKTSDLFTFCVKQLQEYLLTSRGDIRTLDGRHQRADEIDLAIEIVQLLALMFRETETLTTRLTTLLSSNGKTARDLLLVLTCAPEIPDRHITVTGRAAALLMKTQEDRDKADCDEELAKLQTEYMKGATSLLFELILMAEQSSWGFANCGFFSICWIFEILDSAPSVESFLRHLVSYIVQLLQPTGSNQISASQAVMLFQHVSLLHTVIENSPSLTRFIRNNFTEEFKYYIQMPVILEKFPDSYPITDLAIQLIQEVMSQILRR